MTLILGPLKGTLNTSAKAFNAQLSEANNWPPVKVQVEPNLKPDIAQIYQP